MEGSATIVRAANGRLVAFGIGNTPVPGTNALNRPIHYNWSDVHGNFANSASIVLGQDMCRVFGGVLDSANRLVVLLGKDSGAGRIHLYTVRQIGNTNGWDQPVQVDPTNGLPVTTADFGAAITLRSGQIGSHVLQIFLADSSHKMWSIAQAANGVWGAWKLLSTNNELVPFAHDALPSAVTDSSGRAHVFVVNDSVNGTVPQLVHQHDQDSSWSTLPVVNAGHAFLPHPASARANDGRLGIIAVRQPNLLSFWREVTPSSNVWEPEQDVSGGNIHFAVALAPAPAGGFDALSWANNWVALRRLSQIDPSLSTPWQNLASPVPPAAPAGTQCKRGWMTRNATGLLQISALLYHQPTAHWELRITSAADCRESITSFSPWSTIPLQF